VSGVTPEGHSRLVGFLRRLADAFLASGTEAPVRAMAATIQDAVEAPGSRGDGLASCLPVCTHLAQATETARARSVPMADLVDSFYRIETGPVLEPTLYGRPFASDTWLERHANATIWCLWDG
jgi:alkanesulfonate monooxygenase SsuD/methylene tetrahydromethanopterin reductase-like flavin-dependent oxidoreductase (luciferase family)